jgi:hypothetical protein
MSRKEDAAFKEWVEELSAKVEPDEAEAFQKWAGTEAAREVFRGTIGQAELYRRMNELAKTRQELEEWYESEKPKNEALLAEKEELLKQLEELGTSSPPPAAATPGPILSKEELADLRNKAAKAETLDRLIPAVLGDMSMVLKDSIKNDFDVDPREVIKLSLQRGVEPFRAYLELTQEERQKRAEAEHEAERKKWFEDGRRSAMTNSPDHLQPSGPSVVDFLKELDKKGAAAPSSGDRVSAALKEFTEGNF